MFTSRLVTHHPTDRPGVTSVEPVLAEREFTHWLTLKLRSIPEGDQDVGDRVAVYDGALLSDFFAGLPARIAFWNDVLTSERARLAAQARLRPAPAIDPSGPPPPPAPVDTVGSRQIAAYIERLEWVGGLESDPRFRAFNGHRRFHIVAIALRFGIASAIAYLDGETANWGEDEMNDLADACEELEFLIYQQRGTAVALRPRQPLCTPRTFGVTMSALVAQRVLVTANTEAEAVEIALAIPLDTDDRTDNDWEVLDIDVDQVEIVT